MKKGRLGRLLLAIATVAFAAALAVPAMAFADGTWDGTADTSWYNDTDTSFEVDTAEKLAGLANLVNEGNTFDGKTVMLGADIDLAGKEWTPIGTNAAQFNGIFDGGSHTISNLVITGGKNNVGLFGCTNDGEVKNLIVNNAKVSGRLNVGVVAGTPYTSEYSNIKLTGCVEVNGMSYVGGIGGKNAYADWTNITIDAGKGSYVKAVSTENGTAYRTYVGGVIGFMGEGGHKFQQISSNIDVIGDVCDVGGITGIAHYGNSFIGVTCTGNVTNTTSDAENALETGGIAGVWHNGGSNVTFKDLAYTGALSAPNADNAAFPNGGLIGAAYSASGSGAITGDIAVVNGESYATLDNAISAAGNGDTVTILAANTYNVPTNKNITITGAVDGVVFDNIGAKNMVSANVTFNNVTFDYYPNVDYTGLQHSGNLAYNNCTFNGQVFLYGVSETFNGCTFNQKSPNAYNVWTYGAQEVEFNGCTFNCAGKSVLVYNEGACATELAVTNCNFTASQTAEGKAAIEIDTSLMPAGTEVTINNSAATGFDTGSISGETLWNDKKDQTNLTVTVDGVKVWPLPSANLTYAAYVGSSGEKGTPSYRENLQVDLYDVYASESLVVELWSGETKLSTTSMRAADRDDGTSIIARPLTGTITANIVISGRLAGSWDTVWHVAPSANLLPNTIMAYADDKLVDTWAGGFTNEEEANEFKNFLGAEPAAASVETAAGITYYENVADALEAAENGDLVTVYVDTTISGTNAAISVVAGDGAKLAITGGMFANNPSAYVPSGYEASENADGTWTVRVIPYIPPTAPSEPVCGPDAACNVFNDADADAWYHEVIDWAYANGVLRGYDDGSGNVGPGDVTMRTHVAVMMWRMAGEPAASSDPGFADVKQGAWYYDAVAWAKEAGLIVGYQDGSGLFGVADPMTREQMATVLYRLAVLMGCDVSVGEDTNILSYLDCDEISEWAVPALQWAVGTGIVSGYTEDGEPTGYLGPKDDAERAHFAAMLMRLDDAYGIL